MARPLRVEYPGAFYHVMNRGNAGEDIFKSDRDREKFQEYLAIAKERFSLIIHTYCLMTNHYHLLVETAEPNLSRAIQWLNVSYATYFNKKRQRKGHLFQGRFKSILVDADEYLTSLSRYIHLNPVRAKIAETASDYRWSSYAAFIGKVGSPKWLETGYTLSNFGKQKKRAIQNYKAFVEEIEWQAVENPEKDLVGGFILGDNDFINWVKGTFLSGREDNQEIPQLKKLTRQTSPDQIVEQVLKLPKHAEILILGPLIKDKKGEHRGVLEEIHRAGFVRVRIDGILYQLEEALTLNLDRNKKHRIELVVDRLLIDNDLDKNQFESKVLIGIEKAYPKQQNGKVLLPFKRLFFIGYKLHREQK